MVEDPINIAPIIVYLGQVNYPIRMVNVFKGFQEVNLGISLVVK